MTSTAIDRAIECLRELRRTHAKLERASEARRALPPGSSRARVTTANARWATASEAHERARAAFRGAVFELGIVDTRSV